MRDLPCQYAGPRTPLLAFLLTRQTLACCTDDVLPVPADGPVKPTMKTTTAFVVHAIAFCRRYAWSVIAAALLLAIVSSWYAATHFAMTTDLNKLISAHIPWREREAAIENAFPQYELTVAVIDAYDYPDAASDLATFRAATGLAPCTAANGCFGSKPALRRSLKSL